MDKASRNFSDGERWLTAHEDKTAGIYTFSSCITLSDITGDGDTKLVVADLGSGTYNMKLRVYKGTKLITENTIIDLPTGVVDFYMDSTEPHVPAVAIASGSYIYVYKNMRPYFKFTLPSLEICPKEKDLWDEHFENKGNPEDLKNALKTLRGEIGDGALTPRSQRLLMLNEIAELKSFVEVHSGFPLKRQSVVTCISTLKKSHSDENAVSCLVLGTEANTIYILDPEAFTIMSSMTLPAPPSMLSVSGMYDVDFRIVVACRNGSIALLKRGWQRAKTITILNSQCVGLIHREKMVLVATMDQKLSCFTSKGKLAWSVKLPSSVLTICPVEIWERSVFYLAVAMNNRKIHLYSDRNLVDCIMLNDSASAMKFGRFGRENSALVIVTLNGSIIVKILKRTAQFDKINTYQNPTTASAVSKTFNIPKKTKLFVDQTVRERENAVQMHRIFQHDLYKLRLRTARDYVRSLKTGDNPVSFNEENPIKLSAQVLGLGPTFKLVLGLSNTSVNKVSKNLTIIFHNDDRIYTMEKDSINVPALVPEIEYTFEVLVECVSDLGIADQIRVFLMGEKSDKPILSAVINMPIAETV